MSCQQFASVVRPVASSCPGGPAIQYRVQYHNCKESSWRMYAIFRDRERAEVCLDELVEQGIDARLIPYGLIPTGL